jgi:phosphoesterase RecJ-like protein
MLNESSAQPRWSLSDNHPEFAELKNSIARAERILISTHAQPDGDGLGAETALYHYLKAARKEVLVLNPDPLPPRYSFLDPKGGFLHTTKPGAGGFRSLEPAVPEPAAFDLWIIVDTNDPRRLGALWERMKGQAHRIVFLDHHSDSAKSAPNPLYPPHARLVLKDESSSIGELLYQLFVELRLAELNLEMAIGLYVSVMTDTNSFRYARTTPESHRIAAHMIQLGVNTEEIYQQIYSTKELSHVQLMGFLLQNTKTSPDGKLAWMELRRELRDRYRASADDTLSFLNNLLVLRTAEVICIFREEDDGATRVSIKSKGRIVVNEAAVDLGGGGHDFEAGAALRMEFSQAVEKVTSRLGELIRSKL